LLNPSTSLTFSPGWLEIQSVWFHMYYCEENHGVLEAVLVFWVSQHMLLLLESNPRVGSTAPRPPLLCLVCRSPLRVPVIIYLLQSGARCTPACPAHSMLPVAAKAYVYDKQPFYVIWLLFLPKNFISCHSG